MLRRAAEILRGRLSVYFYPGFRIFGKVRAEIGNLVGIPRLEWYNVACAIDAPRKRADMGPLRAMKPCE